LYYGLHSQVPPLAKFQLWSIEDQAYRAPEDLGACTKGDVEMRCFETSL
jgi:hypothetical protein